VVITSDEYDLVQVLDHDVSAVVLPPTDSQGWLADIDAAVQRRALRLERTLLFGASRKSIESMFSDQVRVSDIAPALQAALIEDALYLVDLCSKLAGGSSFNFRSFTEAPTTRCGYHVDTVPPGAPTVGVMRVYCGDGTEYPNPAMITSARDFYAYMAKRDRLLRNKAGRATTDVGSTVSVDEEIQVLDARPPFLRDPAVVTVPPGSLVAFKHLDISVYGSAREFRGAWVHQSPSTGSARLVINVTPGNTQVSRRNRLNQSAGTRKIRWQD
jgi:hypothetical protein